MILRLSSGNYFYPTTVANNGQAIGGTSYQLMPYTVYVGPHYVVKHYRNQEEASKHYYIGSQRIASKLNYHILGDELHSEPEEPMGAEQFKQAGSSGPHVNNVELSDLSENLNRFAMPGIPTFNAGQLAAPGLPQAAPRSWYPCDDFSMEIDPESLNLTDHSEPIVIYDHYTLSQLQCLCRNEDTWAQMLEWGYICPHFEELYFYHSDYLGHTEYITDAGGPALSEVEGYPYQYFYYTPFGESLITQHANTGGYSSSFRFNAKELDEETGNYYYGARYYNPKWSLWLSVDPLAHKYPSMSAYVFTGNNPINAFDPDGRYIIFVGGLRLGKASADQRRWLGGFKIHQKDVYNYWSTNDRKGPNSFGREADISEYYQRKYNDKNVGFTSGSSGWRSSAGRRMNEGRKKAELFHQMVLSGDITLQEGETIKVISHSQGGAHAAGFIEQLSSYTDNDGNQLYCVEVAEYITPHQPTDFSHPEGVYGIQYSHPNDAISSNAPSWLPNGGSTYGAIKGIQEFFGYDIMGGLNQPPCQGPGGNRCGHNVTDNDLMIQQ